MSEPLFDAAAEKRIRRIVYCADQLAGKRLNVWASRYDRAVFAAQSVEELDEALLRIHAKYPHVGLDKIVAEQRG